jgi:Ca2+-transporting ATPase
MGLTGTDVSKEAAQMVLLDDNFATIVAAVEEGRAIYDNLRRFVKFSIAGNLGKVLVMLLAPFLGISVALLPLQLLWLNLLTDGLLGLGLGMEPAGKQVMAHPPRRRDDKFLSADLGWYVLLVGLFIGGIALLIGFLYYRSDRPDDLTWQTMIFTSLAFMQLGQALASRSDDVSLLALGWRSNPVLLVMALIVLLSQLAVLYLPSLETFFKIEPLSAVQLAICIGAGLFTFACIETTKRFRSG